MLRLFSEHHLIYYSFLPIWNQEVHRSVQLAEPDADKLSLDRDFRLNLMLIANMIRRVAVQNP